MRPDSVLPKPEELLQILKESADEVFTKMLDTVVVLVDRHDEQDARCLGTIDIEAVVEYSGRADGAVVLRCSSEGAKDIARDLLMLRDSDPLGLDDIRDALGECANMVSGLLKSKALDSFGDFTLTLPKIEAYANRNEADRCGVLVYALSKGCVAIEVWMHAPEGSA